MARFFFHTDSHIRFTDPEGEELPTVASARATAARAIADMLGGGSEIFWGTKPWTMTVTDAAGLIFFSIDIHGADAPACAGR